MWQQVYHGEKPFLDPCYVHVIPVTEKYAFDDSHCVFIINHRATQEHSWYWFNSNLIAAPSSPSTRAHTITLWWKRYQFSATWQAFDLTCRLRVIEQLLLNIMLRGANCQQKHYKTVEIFKVIKNVARKRERVDTLFNTSITVVKKAVCSLSLLKPVWAWRTVEDSQSGVPSNVSLWHIHTSTPGGLKDVVQTDICACINFWKVGSAELLLCLVSETLSPQRTKG